MAASLLLQVPYCKVRQPLDRIFVAGANNAQISLSAVVRYENSVAPLAVYHQGPFPAVTVSFATQPDVTLQTAHAEHPAGCRRTAHAGGHSRRVRGQCARFWFNFVTPTLADPWRADCRLYRAWRAL